MSTPILSVELIRDWDQYTIEKEPISSYLLMERAASRIAQFIIHNFSNKQPVFILAGAGNNGGDGVAVARILSENGFEVFIKIVPFSSWSSNTKKNIQKLPPQVVEVENIKDFNFHKNTLVVDALFGSGLSRKIEGDLTELINRLNLKNGIKIAIDTPSGLFGDYCNAGDVVFKADLTLTLEVPKKSMADVRSLDFTGRIFVIPIGLHQDYLKEVDQSEKWFLKQDVSMNQRALNAHKGDFGFVSVIGGNGKTPGAPILASMAALSSGAGLVALGIPKLFQSQLGVSYPEIMQLEVQGDSFLEYVKLHPKTKAVLVGPGLGVTKQNKVLLQELFSHDVHFIVDADALNTIAKFKLKIPEKSILTPHVREMERLLGVDKIDEQNLVRKVIDFAKSQKVYVVLKSAHTKVITPEGHVFQHLGGNDALAKGGTGDVLAGIISGLLAQNNDPLWACNTGIEIHQHAAHLFCKSEASHALTPLKMIDLIGKSIKELR